MSENSEIICYINKENTVDNLDGRDYNKNH